MPRDPERLTETPKATTTGVLQAVLGQIHLSGSLILRAEFTAPWSYESPDVDTLRQLIQPEAKRIILFHVVPEGECWIELSGARRETRLEVHAGDVIVLPYADQHVVGSPGGARAVPISDIMPPAPWTDLPVIRYGGGGACTQFVCGYLLCDDLLFNPFLRALPSLFAVRPPEGPASEWIRSSLRYALEGATPGGTQRLYELIFVEVMCLYADSLAPGSSGWLSALSDPVVGRALSCLHAAPAEPWTVEGLAARVATSRSVLDDRFRKRLGRAPMRYLTEWRLQLAADLLRSSPIGLAEVAGRVGYESESAFNRAFRRFLGEPPARWREQERARREKNQ